MRVVFLTQDDPLYILPFFEEFFRLKPEAAQVVAVFTCKTMGDRGRLRLLRELAHLYGPLGLARLLGRVAVSRVLSTLPGCRNARKFHSIGQLCRAFGVRHVFLGNPNQEQNRAQIAALAPDLLVSIACPYILKAALLQLPPLGCINMHHAPLPRYKGMMPTFWQMYHGEKNVGVTIHTMAAKVDEGDALLQESLAIEEGESLDHLIRRSKRHGAHCMARALSAIAESSQQTMRLDHSKGSYFTFPTSAEMKEFRRRGFRAI
ncbi:MAG TPA: formyl transferase [Candidatus Saccharimonadales bacterium]|jgi:methionyl-tRNA formyltransferase|nr:formyl transferase [Candidatus Saccharimonadales bacterium]